MSDASVMLVNEKPPQFKKPTPRKNHRKNETIVEEDIVDLTGEKSKEVVMNLVPKIIERKQLHAPSFVKAHLTLLIGEG